MVVSHNSRVLRFPTVFPTQPGTPGLSTDAEDILWLILARDLLQCSKELKLPPAAFGSTVHKFRCAETVMSRHIPIEPIQFRPATLRSRKLLICISPAPVS